MAAKARKIQEILFLVKGMHIIFVQMEIALEILVEEVIDNVLILIGLE